ncbi:MAG: hypothetical protein ACR2IR_03565 [Acidimicrobiia bacterium]
MARVQVTPETFTLVDYDAGAIAGLTEELAAKTGFPDDVDITVEIDEELPLPLTGATADVVDGRAALWFSGANFEDGRYRTHFDEPVARTELAIGLLRAADRLGPGFADAPVDEQLSDAHRHAWEVWAEGRVARLGEHARRVRRLYHFRLYNGFTDVADAAFERLWSADALAWSDIEAICAECAASDPRPALKKKGSIRRETLKAASG